MTNVRQIHNVVTDYYRVGDTLHREVRGGDELWYYYGADGLTGFSLNGVPYYYRKDAQGSITHILDNAGAIVAKYNYDAFGNHVVRAFGTNIGDVNPFRYRGYYFDSETGLYSVGLRYYDPEVGRWISADSPANMLEETVNGLNLYAYCLNNPVMMVDPDGQMPFLAILAKVAITVGKAALAVGKFLATVGKFVWKGLKWLGGKIGGFLKRIVHKIGTLFSSRLRASYASKYGVKVSTKNLSKIQSYFNKMGFANDIENITMMERLENSLSTGMKIKGADANFYLHELKELSYVSKGIAQTEAHIRAIDYYSMNPYSIYHPEAILRADAFYGAKSFNTGFYNFFGI